MKKIRPLTLLGLILFVGAICLAYYNLKQPEITTVKAKAKTPAVEVVEVQTDDTAKTEKEYRFSVTPEPVFPDSK